MQIVGDRGSLADYFYWREWLFSKCGYPPRSYRSFLTYIGKATISYCLWLILGGRIAACWFHMTETENGANEKHPENPC